MKCGPNEIMAWWIWFVPDRLWFEDHWSILGVSNTRAACGPQRSFVMLFGNLQIINICVAKCLEKRCRKIIESKLNDTQCGFCPGCSTTDHISLSSKILRNLGSMLKMSSQICWPRESIRCGSLWKAIGSVAWVRCWRPPVAGRKVTVFLLRNLYPCQELNHDLSPLVLDSDKGVCCQCHRSFS